jgi:hypothetical protein
MLTFLENRELDEDFQLVMVNNTNKGIDGWKRLMQLQMNEKGWNLNKQLEALNYLGIK